MRSSCAKCECAEFRIPNPGKYDVRITFMRHSAADGTPPTETDYASLGSVWASVKHRGSREVDFANRVSPQLDSIITAPYSALARSVTSDDRIEFTDAVGTRTYEIDGPPQDIDEAHTEMRFECVEMGR